MELHNFDSNIHDVDLNAGHDQLHSDLNNGLSDLQDHNNLLDTQGMGIQHDATNSDQMDMNQASPLSNPLENPLDSQHLTSYQVDYSSTISTHQHLDLSPSSPMHDGFNHQHLDAHNVHNNNLLEHQNLADSHSQAHNLDHHHDLQRTGTSRSELLKDAKYDERQAQDYNNWYKTYSQYADDFRKDGNYDEASHWQDKADTAATHADEWTHKAQDARNKADDMS